MNAYHNRPHMQTYAVLCVFDMANWHKIAEIFTCFVHIHTMLVDALLWTNEFNKCQIVVATTMHGLTLPLNIIPH